MSPRDGEGCFADNRGGLAYQRKIRRPLSTS
jgi:hypothetical protein